MAQRRNTCLATAIVVVALVSAACGQTSPSAFGGRVPGSVCVAVGRGRAVSATVDRRAHRRTDAGPVRGALDRCHEPDDRPDRRLDEQGRGRRHRRQRLPGPALRQRRRLREPRSAGRQPRLLNPGPGQPFTDATQQSSVTRRPSTRVIKVRDLNADSFADIVLGTTYLTQSQLFLGTANGTFTKATDQLPQVPLSVGDLEIGDVDADGDPDIVLADWGAGSPMENQGAPVRLWLNDGKAGFKEAPAAACRPRPSASRGSSNCSTSTTTGTSTSPSPRSAPRRASCSTTTARAHSPMSRPSRMPHFTNNYEFEPMDLDGDGYLDLVTINDGRRTSASTFSATTARVAMSMRRGSGGRPPPTRARTTTSIAFLDVDSDGDADFVVGALTGRTGCSSTTGPVICRGPRPPSTRL